ncbi:MAG: hypothetical protein V4692_06610 [Bdellovibrionota bacterium]
MRALIVLSTGVLLVFSAACAHSPKHSDALEGAQDGAAIEIFPQWHLSSQVDTKSKSETAPQAKNQNFIYRSLDKEIALEKIKSVIVEGCEGEIQTGFPLRFNGWTLADLENLLKSDAAKFDDLLTQVGLKIEAKYGEKVDVLCGDDLKLIQRHQLILSDLRGYAGFRYRLDQFKNDPKRRDAYLKNIASVLFPAGNSAPPLTYETGRNALNSRMKERIAEFKTVLAERNAVFVKRLKFAEKPAAIVIGALHVADLKRQLDSGGLSNRVREVEGLPGDEAGLIQSFEKLLD